MSHSVRKFVITLLPVSALLALTTSFWAQESKPQVIMGPQNLRPVQLRDDLPPGAVQGKARTACLECHEARIILQQRLSKAAWTKEVDKMVKWGAVVDNSDRDALIDYLSSNFGADQPAYEPQRTAAGKNSKGKSK